MELWGRMCGWTLARAHARSGDRVAIAAYLGKSDAFDRAIGTFSVAYAEQNERDYKALKEAVRSGGSPRARACKRGPASGAEDRRATKPK